MSPVALVTGASRGIGRGVALALADAGYDVAVTARTVEEGTSTDALPGSLASTTAAIEARGRAALGVPLDLLDRAAIAPAVDAVLDRFRRVDVLVNNAIYTGAGQTRFLDEPVDELERRVFGNVTAQLLVTQRVVRAMVAAGGGTVVDVTSGAGMHPPPAPVGEGGWALAYGVTKGGFHRIAEVLAVELGAQGIRAYNVQPGFVATERTLARDDLAWVASRGKPPAVVGAVVTWLLAQPDGTIPNGSTVEVDDVARELDLWPEKGT